MLQRFKGGEMRKYGSIIWGIFIFNFVYGMEIKNFWDAKNCVFRDASFSETEDKFRVDYTVVRTPEGTLVPNQFCVFDGAKDMFRPVSFYEPTRLDDKRLSLEAPRTVKMLAREVERSKEWGEKQRALEYGYLVPIFMDVIFPQITKYAEPPKAIIEVVSKREGLIPDIIYPVDVLPSEMTISSIIATRKPGKKPGTSLEEMKQWSGGAFEISWAEVLPEAFKRGIYYEGVSRPLVVEKIEKVRVNYGLLDSLCIFPLYFPAKSEGELDKWIRKATPYVISNFAWRKDMFNSLMEVGFFASFFAKYIFPIIQKKIEIPDRFKKEGFVVTYFTEADINALTLWATAEGHDEKWKGARYTITWDEALPPNVKKD